MMIPVKYSDGRHDLVKPQLLDRLLSDRKLAGFKRRNGWVEIGRDPVRGQARGREWRIFAGRERRAH